MIRFGIQVPRTVMIEVDVCEPFVGEMIVAAEDGGGPGTVAAIPIEPDCGF